MVFVKLIRGITFILILCFLGALTFGVRLGSFQRGENFTAVVVIEMAVVLLVSSLCFSYTLTLRKNQWNKLDKIRQMNTQLVVILQDLNAKETQQISIEMHDFLILGRNIHITHVTFPNDLTISSQHCRLIYNAGVMYLEDLHSTNGTYLNGTKLVGKEEVHPGDILIIGKESLQVMWSIEATRFEE